MVIRKPNPETHQNCRSLLQKAVRRGCVYLIPKIVDHLFDVGDKTWVKNRTGVIVFEECWPRGSIIGKSLEKEEIIRILEDVALSEKYKDAAGLGSLAYEFSKGDPTVLSNTTTDRPIKIISEAIKKPKEFWDWVLREDRGKETAFLECAHSAYKRGGWPWDRAFMQAAAYLALTQGIPLFSSQKIAIPCDVGEFPFWVSIDKHTEDGKKAIKMVAEKSGKNARKISWLFFYFASAVENSLVPSYWWDREMEWRLSKIGYSQSHAVEEWNSILPFIKDSLVEEGEKLRAHILDGEESNQKLKQLTIF